MDTLAHDIRFGFRMLARNPRFTLVALLTLALGIGVNSAMFSVVNGVLLRPLPYKDAERIVMVWNRAPGVGISRLWLSDAEFFYYRDHSQALEDAAAYSTGNVDLTGMDEPARIGGAFTSAGLFS